MLDMSHQPATHDLVWESRKTQQKDSLLMGIHENTTHTHRTGNLVTEDDTKRTRM